MGAPEKPLAPFRGATLLDAVVNVAQPQVSALAINIRADAEDAYADWRARGIACLHDPFSGNAGPLGGVVAGLEWAAEAGSAQWLATFPADAPFLPRDLVARLAAVREPHAARPVVATSAAGIEGLCALWPLDCLPRLREGVEDGSFRSVWQTLAAFGAIHRSIDDPQAFFNVNTPADLAEAERIAALRRPSIPGANP